MEWTESLIAYPCFTMHAAGTKIGSDGVPLATILWGSHRGFEKAGRNVAVAHTARHCTVACSDPSHPILIREVDSDRRWRPVRCHLRREVARGILSSMAICGVCRSDLRSSATEVVRDYLCHISQRQLAICLSRLAFRGSLSLTVTVRVAARWSGLFAGISLLLPLHER
jgi:hypothetical protein